MTPPLSVMLAVRDEEETLPACLQAVAGSSDDIVVVLDPRTRDRSRLVAERHGARVVEREFDGLGRQRNFGVALTRHPWVLVLDADEVVTPELAAAAAAAVRAPARTAYRVTRANVVLGRRLRFGDWGRDRVVRLFDRRAAAFSDDPVHPVVEVERAGTLAGVLEHHTLRSLDQYLPKVHDYALRGAADQLARGARGGVGRAAVRASWRFVRAFVLRGGVLDGHRGLLVAALAAHGTFVKWSAVWARRAR